VKGRRKRKAEKSDWKGRRIRRRMGEKEEEEDRDRRK
jgi:hypothetical protein